MPGAETPSDDDLSIATGPNNATAAGLLEALSEVQRRTPGVGQASAPTTYEISAGSIAPETGLFMVDTEGLTTFDNLDSISVDAYLPGSVVWIFAADPARAPTLRHLQGGAGQIDLLKGSDFTLLGARWIILELRGTTWFERDRGFGGDAASMRAWLELGTAAVLDDGVGDAATLEGNAAAAFLPVAGQAADSALLQGLAAAAFARLDQAAQQSFLGAIRTRGGVLTIETNSAASALLHLVANSVLRTQMFFNPTSEVFELRVLDSDGTTLTGGLRIRENEIPELWDTVEDEWVSLQEDPIARAAFPTLGRILWDKLDAAEDRSAGPDTYVIHSALIEPLPNTSGAVVYKISAGLEVEPWGSNAVVGRLAVHIGPNGDETDAEVASIPVNSGFGGTGSSYSLDLPEVFDTYEAGDRVSIVLETTTVSGPRVQPSIDNGFTRESRTFLRLEQIG